MFCLTVNSNLDNARNALLISVTNKSRIQTEFFFNELASLAYSAGLNVCGLVVQRRQQPDIRTFIGSGKLNELLIMAMRLGTEVLVIDQKLSPSQAHILALRTDSRFKFIDRTQLILDIFAQRAKSREGKLQVEMAQMRYLLPRLAMRDDGLSRLTGGIGGRGPGETKLEIDRRRVYERLNRLKRELIEIGLQRQRQRSRREKVKIPIVSMVGYTNAGKTTLLNTLTNSKILTEDRLFATLDPTTRRVYFSNNREVIITDTVGFIHDLPEELRQAFAATLEELNHADLLLHIVDASNSQLEEHIIAVENILGELHLLGTPRLLVLNKIDRISSKSVGNELIRRFNGIAISALDNRTLTYLLACIEKILS